MTPGISVLFSSGGIFIGLFSAVLLLAAPWAGGKANRALAALLFLCSLNIAHPVVGQFLPSVVHSHAPFLFEPLQLLMGPLVAAYVRRLTGKAAPLRPRRFLHALPFVLVTAFVLTPVPRRLESADSFPAASTAFWILLCIQVLAYEVNVLRSLHRYRGDLREERSNVAGIDLGWVTWLSLAFLALYLCYMVVLMLVIHRAGAPHVRGFLSAAFTVLVCVLSFRGLTQKETPVLEPRETVGEIGKYRRSAMPAEEAAELRERLERAMEKDRLFLDSELDLSSLAARVGAARNQLSYVINQKLGKNFYDFVNEYRVREAARLMADPARAQDKILAIALDAGFNSKPTFNAVFRKLTGRTPSDLRRKDKKVV